jgi:hypothetical protein
MPSVYSILCDLKFSANAMFLIQPFFQISTPLFGYLFGKKVREGHSLPFVFKRHLTQQPKGLAPSSDKRVRVAFFFVSEVTPEPLTGSKGRSPLYKKISFL